MMEQVDNLLEGSAMTTLPRPANSHWDGGVGFSLDWLDWRLGSGGNRTGEWFVAFAASYKLLITGNELYLRRGYCTRSRFV